MIRRMFWLAALSGVGLASALPAAAHPTPGPHAGPAAKGGAECCQTPAPKGKAGHGEACEDCEGEGGDCCAAHDLPRRKPVTPEHGVSLRYLPTVNTLALGHGMKAVFDNGLSIGGEGNLALQLSPAAGFGNWLSGYGGVVPGYQIKAGPVGLGVEALVGLGWMARSVGPSETLQGRIIWAAEPRVKVGYQADHWGLGLTGGYLFTPVMNDLGGFTVGLSLTGKGFFGPPTARA